MLRSDQKGSVVYEEQLRDTSNVSNAQYAYSSTLYNTAVVW